MSTSKRALLVLVVAAGIACVYVAVTSWTGADREKETLRKLYWFIPDGMRAEPELFDIFAWAEEGRLPNVKKMMERGSYGFCMPTFPTHTPTNFATLFTGAYPEVHGVNDGPMHTEGNPLDRVSVGGFSSAAKLVEPIWMTLEKSSSAEIALLSVPGSTPPELERGVTVRGRWGGWGADFHAVNFQSGRDLAMRRTQGRAARLFFFGPALTQYPMPMPASNWKDAPPSFSPGLEVEMSAWGAVVHAFLHDTRDDGQEGYDRIAFSVDKVTLIATLGEGAWSDWLPIVLRWQVPGTELSRDIETSFRIRVIKLDPDGFFRVRFFFNNINRFLTEPPEVAAELVESVGPMVDFVDNFPPQLIFYPEDKKTFLEEAEMSLHWHRRAVRFLLESHEPDVLINDIYTPNQMLTSRWWMGYVDPASTRYGDVSEDERKQLWDEVYWLYRKLDDICGELLEKADENTIVVLSSDHGAVPLDRWVRLNNLFAREGLLSFTIDPDSGEPRIDWGRTKAVYLKMDGVYIDPDGLEGDWKRASGPAYEALRQRVRALLLELEDEGGVKPVAKIVGWEEARRELRLLESRVGDLVIANRPGYGWSEEMTASRKVFTTPLKTGYKQAILAENEPGMWTPFLILGPGVKRGQFLGTDPIRMVDQYPTILHLLGREVPETVQGRVLTEILESP